MGRWLKKLDRPQALALIVGLLLALAWAAPTLGKGVSKVAAIALGRANEAFYNANRAVSYSDSARTTAGQANATASSANSVAAQAQSVAGSAQSTAGSALSTANAALSAANGSPQVIASASHSFDPSSINGGTCANASFTQFGVASSDTVIVTPPDTLPNGIVAQAFTSGNNVELRLCNATGGAIDPPNLSYRFLVLR